MIRTLKTLLATAAWIAMFAVSVFVALWASGAIDGDYEMRWAWQSLDGPDGWKAAAPARDLLIIPGHDIKYWGDPRARYSAYGTRRAQKPKAIVVHFTRPRPLLDLVRYGHKRDPNRGNNAFGYHFYIGRDGTIVQGAPLSRRTNHIKSAARKERRPVARHLWSGNTIGVSLIGACNPLRAPDVDNWRSCAQETPSAAQLEAGLIVIRALQQRFALPCDEVYGHGDLQTDRRRFEGHTLSRIARDGCAELVVSH